MAFLYRGAGTAANGNNSAGPLAPGLPSGWQVGDLLVVVFQNFGGTNSRQPSIASPWTSYVFQNGTASHMVAWKIAESGQATPSITLTGTGATNDTQVSRCFAFYSNNGSTVTFDSAGTNSTNASADNIGPISGVTVPTGGGLVLISAGKTNDFNGNGTLANWTQAALTESTTGNDAGVTLMYRLATPAGATGDLTVNDGGATASDGLGFGKMLVFREVLPEREGVSTGTQTVAGTSAGAVAVTSASTGTQTTTGNAAGTVAAASRAGASVATQSTAGTASGTAAVAGASTGTQSSAGSVAGSVLVVAASTGTQASSGSASGAGLVGAVSSATQATTGSAAGTALVTATSIATQTSSGAAVGIVTSGRTGESVATQASGGSASGAVSVAGSSTGTQTTTGSANAAVLIWASSAAVQSTSGTSAGTVVVTGASTGTQTVGGASTGSSGAPITLGPITIAAVTWRVGVTMPATATPIPIGITSRAPSVPGVTTLPSLPTAAAVEVRL